MPVQDLEYDKIGFQLGGSKLEVRSSAQQSRNVGGQLSVQRRSLLPLIPFDTPWFPFICHWADQCEQRDQFKLMKQAKRTEPSAGASDWANPFLSLLTETFSVKTCAESVWTDNCPNARSSWKSKRTAQIRMEPSRVFKESKEIDKQISQLLQSAPSVSSFSQLLQPQTEEKTN